MTTTSRSSSASGSNSPYQLRERARRAIAQQPAKTVTVLSSLLAAQDELRYLPYEAIDEVSKRTGASVNEVWSVASFYPNFRFTPPALHSVEVCWGPTCHVLGAQQLLHRLVDHLGLEGEGDTEDGNISLKYNTCLGVCPHGPAMSFDSEIAGHMTAETVIARVENLRSGHDATQEQG